MSWYHYKYTKILVFLSLGFWASQNWQPIPECLTNAGLCVQYLIPFPACCFHRTHGDLVSGLYQQILLSLQKVLTDPVRPLCSHYGAVVGLHAVGWKVRTLAFLTDLFRVAMCVGKIAFMYILL